jgi:hypothetical protein
VLECSEISSTPNANRTAVLDQEGKVLPGAAEVLGKENEVNIAKVAWLSRKYAGKLYGSMVVYVTKGSEAVRLLQGQYFHLAGQSAYTSVFEPRSAQNSATNVKSWDTRRFRSQTTNLCKMCSGRTPPQRMPSSDTKMRSMWWTTRIVQQEMPSALSRSP